MSHPSGDFGSGSGGVSSLALRSTGGHTSLTHSLTDSLTHSLTHSLMILSSQNRSKGNTGISGAMSVSLSVVSVSISSFDVSRRGVACVFV
jgi:hypothetical protein